MAKIWLRQRKFTYLNTPTMKSPQIRVYEEIWQDDRGEVTYWDNEGVYRHRIYPEDRTNSPSVFAERPRENRLDRKIKKVEIVAEQPTSKKIAASLNSWWQKAAKSSQKLTRRLQQAWQAAYRELTRPQQN